MNTNKNLARATTKSKSDVLYHLSPGQICHDLGQDPSHSDDDVTVYAAKTSATRGIFIQRSITSTSFFASIWFASVWFASVRAESPADKADLRLIPTPLGYFYEHHEFGLTRGSIIVEEDVDKRSSKSGQKRCKGDKVPLGDNRGATRGEICI